MRKKTRSQEIYLDNAATSYPKAPGVLEALRSFTFDIGASAGRGAYPRAVETGRIISDTRALLAKLMGVADPLRFIFTFNASDSLNLAIHGLKWKKGDRVLVSEMEHNSVLRPVNKLKEEIGIKVDKIHCDKEGYIDLKRLKRGIKKRTKLIAVLHASNVLGTITPVREISAIARSKGIPFLVDAAQSAGSMPINLKDMGADLVAFPGHKALLGPLGTGALYIAPGMELDTIREGGTGSVSELETQPDFYPDKYEPGSHNALGIAGLKAALEFLLKEGIEKIRAHKKAITGCFLKGLEKIQYVKYFGPRNVDDQVGVVSLSVEGYTPETVADRLFSGYGIMTRYGLHCAPGAHRLTGTYPKGAVRFSFSCLNKMADVEKALKAVREIAGS